MKCNRKLLKKANAENLVIPVLNPFLLFYGWLGKAIKLLLTRRHKIAAGALSIVLALSILPVNTMTVFAGLDVESAANDPSTCNNPVLGSGLNMFKNEAKGEQYVYYGQYPQDRTDANSYQPIKWYVWVADQSIHSSGNYKVYTYSCDSAIGLVSEKVLDSSPWISNVGNWKLEDERWLVSYHDSALRSFLSGTFLSKAFTAAEKAVMSNQSIYTYGGTYEFGLKFYEIETEYYDYKVYAPCALNDKVHPNAPLTAYAASKGVPTYTYNGQTYGVYWARTIPASTARTYFVYDGVVRIYNPGYAWQTAARKNSYGVRPLTRVLGDEILLASAVGAKNNAKITNADMPESGEYVYKLTIRDSNRTFEANQPSISYNSDSFDLSVSYTGAKVGADEYISCIVTDMNDNVFYYERLKTSTSAAGSVTVTVPYSSFIGNRIKVKVFNEQLCGEKLTDYASTFSTFEVNKPHEHIWNTEWTCDSTHHWHDCEVADCYLSNGEKSGYGAHSYTEEVVKKAALKTPATTTEAAVYYKSCICGVISTTETFSYGSPADHRHDDSINYTMLDSTMYTGGILAEGYYYLAGDITLTQPIEISDCTVHLCLNGHTIKRGHKGACISISNTGSLYLYDCSSDSSGSITGNPDISDQFNRGIINKGTFVMYGGNISGHIASYCAGVDNTGTFVMNGGEITNNQAKYDGGGVTVYDGGSFTMNGGTISGNTAGRAGGGVAVCLYDYLSNSNSFTMNNGTISGNQAGQYGGGVFYKGYTDNSFIMNNGLITGNICGYNTYGSGGGGVYAKTDSNAVVMIGGSSKIIDNY